MWDLSSLTRDRTHIPCIARRILNHQTTREVPAEVFSLSINRLKSCARSFLVMLSWLCMLSQKVQRTYLFLLFWFVCVVWVCGGCVSVYVCVHMHILTKLIWAFSEFISLCNIPECCWHSRSTSADSCSQRAGPILWPWQWWREDLQGGGAQHAPTVDPILCLTLPRVPSPVRPSLPSEDNCSPTVMPVKLCLP